jgi:hypothetical protein
MSHISPQLQFSRRAAARYAALSAIAEGKARQSAAAHSHGWAWQRVRALLVKPA